MLLGDGLRCAAMTMLADITDRHSVTDTDLA